MASSTQLREWWAAYKCAPEKMVRVEFPSTLVGGETSIGLLVADVAVPVWESFVAIMRDHDYTIDDWASGTYNCRNIAGTSSPSLHSYGIAVDLNPGVNCYGCESNDYPDGFVEDVLALEVNGQRLFTFGGFWSNKDQMHWQVNVSPAELEDYSMFSEHEVAELKRMVASVDEVGSNGTFPQFLIPWFRKWRSFEPADFASVDVDEIVDEIVSRLQNG